MYYLYFRWELIVINWNGLMQNGPDQTVRYVNFNYKLNFKKNKFPYFA